MQTPTQSTTAPLSLGRMTAFSIADFFGGGAFNIINFLFPGFLALAVGLPPGLAGLVIFIARIFDAVIDPIIGYWSDKLRVRFGTRRGTLFVSAPLIVVSLFLTFYPYDNPSIMVRFWLSLLSYMLFCAVHSSVMIPYYSLTSEATEDYTERSRMTSLRLGFSIFASIVCVALPGVIVGMFDGNTGYMAMSLIFGTIFMLCVGATAIFAKEGIPAPKQTERVVFREFLLPFRVKSFRQYLYMFLCVQITMAVMSALFFFYIDFYFSRSLTAQGMGNMVGLIGAAILFGMQIVALPFYLALMKKTDKKTAYIVGALIWIVGALFLFLVPPNAPAVVLYILAAVLGFGISGPGLVPHAIFPDVIDVGNLQFGTRCAGAFSGVSNMVIQIGQAAGVAIVMAGIGIAGFVEQDIQAGATQVVSQPLSAQYAIIGILALTPLFLMSIGVCVCARYRLNKARHAQVLAALEGTDADKEAVLQSL
ncbi:MAG: MFS transporter [Oscillospiraceae bacterium]|nr:MFS transporter [Oscillospiraceae bacterium]